MRNATFKAMEQAKEQYVSDMQLDRKLSESEKRMIFWFWDRAYFTGITHAMAEMQRTIRDIPDNLL